MHRNRYQFYASLGHEYLNLNDTFYTELNGEITDLKVYHVNSTEPEPDSKLWNKLKTKEKILKSSRVWAPCYHFFLGI